MARQRKEKEVKIKLKQPDRSASDPSRQTLLDLAEQRGLLKLQGQDGESEDDEPPVGRLGESILWSLSLTMLHFTLDVLVSNQYAIEIVWRDLVVRAAQAFPGKPLSYQPSLPTPTNCPDSHPLPLLFLPSSCFQVDSATSITSTYTTFAASNILLR